MVRFIYDSNSVIAVGRGRTALEAIWKRSDNACLSIDEITV